MRLIHCSYLAVVLLLAAACSHSPTLRTPLRPLMVRDLWEDQSVRRQALGAFTGKLEMSYQGKKQSVSGKGRIWGRHAGMFRVELRDPLGRLHYVLTNQQAELVGYYPRNHQAFRENTGGRVYFRRLLGVSLPLSEMVGLFAGVLPPNWQAVKPLEWEWDLHRGAFRADWEQGGEKLTAWIDSENVAIRSLVWTRKDQTIEVDFSGFENCCEGKNSFSLAYEAKVRMPSQNTSVSVEWDSLAPTTQQMAPTVFEYHPLEGDKVTELRD